MLYDGAGPDTIAAMKDLLLPVIVGIFVMSAAQAQSGRAAGYDLLENFVGRWTIKGREDTYSETCAWFHGRFHVVCNTQIRRADGTTAHSMSILGYLPNENTYTYHGIGSLGRNEIQRGEFRDRTFVATRESVANGKRTVHRVRMGPFGGREVGFVSDEAVADGPWSNERSFTYVKLD